MAHIGKFVEEVKQVDYLNLFINSLSEVERGEELEFMRPQDQEDLIRREHTAFMAQEIRGEPKEAAVSTKVNLICEAIKKELWRLNE